VTAVNNDDSKVEEGGGTNYNSGIILGDTDNINFFLVILDLKIPWPDFHHSRSGT
jgi:hypothetical protein